MFAPRSGGVRGGGLTVGEEAYRRTAAEVILADEVGVDDRPRPVGRVALRLVLA